MTPAQVDALEGLFRARNRLLGIGVQRDPRRHFGPGGIEEAARLCAEASRDLLSFLRPPADLPAARVEVSAPRRGALGGRYLRIRFDSPFPSGRPPNDRVVARVYLPPRRTAGDKTLVFHHPIYQRRWTAWEWFLGDLHQRIPVAVMAAPYHFERTPPGEFSGEGIVNANPWRLFESFRQWTWDQKALQRALEDGAGLRVSGAVGFSMGAFCTLLGASAGALDVPIVSIASTNRYVWGLTRGVMGRPTLEAMRAVGIDLPRLRLMAGSVQLDRYVGCLRGTPVLFVAGRHDRVDPPPSAERLERALQPSRSVHLDAGHATLLFHRRRIIGESVAFFEEQGVL